MATTARRNTGTCWGPRPAHRTIYRLRLLHGWSRDESLYIDTVRRFTDERETHPLDEVPGIAYWFSRDDAVATLAAAYRRAAGDDRTTSGASIRLDLVEYSDACPQGRVVEPWLNSAAWDAV